MPRVLSRRGLLRRARVIYIFGVAHTSERERNLNGGSCDDVAGQTNKGIKNVTGHSIETYGRSPSVFFRASVVAQGSGIGHGV